MRSTDALIRQLQGLVRPCDGSPEGVVAAPPGSLACDRANGDVYKKASGTGDTGWIELIGASGAYSPPIPQSDVTGLVSDLALKSNVGHTHAQSDVASLVSDLAAKQPLDTELTQIAAATFANDDFVQKKAGSLTNRTLSQVVADLQAVAGWIFASAVGFPSGSASVPGAWFRASNNGIYSSASGVLDFAAAGVRKLAISGARILATVPIRSSASPSYSSVMYSREGTVNTGLNVAADPGVELVAGGGSVLYGSPSVVLTTPVIDAQGGIGEGEDNLLGGGSFSLTATSKPVQRVATASGETAPTITLPQITDLLALGLGGVNKPFKITDCGLASALVGASTKNITVNTYAGDTFNDGTTSKVISTDGGCLYIIGSTAGLCWQVVSLT